MSGIFTAAERKRAEYHRKYYEANKDALLEYHRKYYEANKDRIKQRRLNQLAKRRQEEQA